MAEIQRTSLSGEMTQRFIEFVMMQTQHAALFLGQIPNPQTGEASVNLEAASMFIDQLEMIHEKTRGNLSAEEEKIISNALANLQMAFEEVAGGAVAGGEVPPEKVEEEPKIASTPAITTDTNIGSDSKKRFSKSYGG